VSASSRLPILIAGAGALGGALIAGWRRGGAIASADMIVRDPQPGREAIAAAEAGAALNPPDHQLARAKTLLLAVKPQIWRAVAAEIAPHLDREAVVVSVVAGVGSRDLDMAFEGRRIVRVMPTTAAAIGEGAASVWTSDPQLREEIGALFAPLGAVIDLDVEDLIHVATAASGSAPAYLYAFIEALEAAAVGAGMDPDSAARMVRATITGAAALLRQSGDDPAHLRRAVTSPGGTTAAALGVLMAEGGFDGLLARAVAAAVTRSRELGA